jgi:hypothetical protein
LFLYSSIIEAVTNSLLNASSFKYSIFYSCSFLFNWSILVCNLWCSLSFKAVSCLFCSEIRKLAAYSFFLAAFVVSSDNDFSSPSSLDICWVKLWTSWALDSVSCWSSLTVEFI